MSSSGQCDASISGKLVTLKRNFEKQDGFVYRFDIESMIANLLAVHLKLNAQA